VSTKQTLTEPARAMSDAELLRMQEASGRLRRYPQGDAPAGYIHPDNVRRLEAGETVAFRKKPYQGEHAIPVFIGSAPVAELQWSEVTEPNEQIRYTHVLAESPLGRFTIEWKSWKPHDTFCVYLNGDYLDTSMSLDEAKSIALKKLSDMARALAGFAALASAPVAGEAVSSIRVFVKDGKASHPASSGPRLPDGFHVFHLAHSPLVFGDAAPQASEANGQWRDLALKFDAQRMVFRDLLKVVAGKLAAVAGARDDEANKMLDMARDALASSPGECLKAQASGPITHCEAGRSNGDGTYEAVPVRAAPQPADEARYERLEREHLGDADKGTGIYHPDNKRAPVDLATMLLWLKRRMTWGMVSIPGAEVARLVGEIEALQRGQHDADIEARARQLVADAAASGQVVRIDLVPRQPLAMGNLDMVVDVRPARHGLPSCRS